jgi:hypothetical protein
LTLPTTSRPGPSSPRSASGTASTPPPDTYEVLATQHDDTWLARDPAHGTTQTRPVVQPGTGRALAEEDVVIKPRGTTAGFAPGTVLDYTAYKYAGWTNAKPTC